MMINNTFVTVNKKVFKTFFFCLLYAVIIGYAFNFINSNFIHFENAKHNSLSRNEIIFISLVFAPVIETLFCQHLLYKLLVSIKVRNDTINIFIMSFVFSQLHWYHWTYVLMVFFGSLSLNYFYIKTFKIKNEITAFILTIFLHLLYNLYGFLFVN